MQSSEALNEAERVMVFCNACRYCEGFCAVFPAMELRRAFSEQDLKYLANLCHNCRDCYYACQYAPPHEFSLNIPKALAELRLDTYQEFCWPRLFGRLFRRNGFFVSLIAMTSVVMMFLITLFCQGPSVLFGLHVGAKAFYNVTPYIAIILPFSILAILAFFSLLMGVHNFWRKTGGKPRQLLNMSANIKAVQDALRLKYLDGGGYGCNYPDDRFSMARRWLHHIMFYGFILCFTSTTIAAIYDHVLHWSAPYSFWSWPVTLGTFGGVALLIGTCGLLYLKQRMDAVPASPRACGMDVSFLLLLLLTTLTGLMLLMMRATSAMGTLLNVHLGLVAGLFITMPYSKFIHSVYRYAALVKNAIEQSRDKN